MLKWNPDRINASTRFILGSKVARILAIGQRGSLYLKYPRAYKVSFPLRFLSGNKNLSIFMILFSLLFLWFYSMKSMKWIEIGLSKIALLLVYQAKCLLWFWKMFMKLLHSKIIGDFRKFYGSQKSIAFFTKMINFLKLISKKLMKISETLWFFAMFKDFNRLRKFKNCGVVFYLYWLY